MFALKLLAKYYTARRSGKNSNFFAHKIFFFATSSCFADMKYFFVLHQPFFLLTWNTFSCNINTFLSTPNYFLCKVKLFVSTQNRISCNTKFLFWTSFRMLSHGDIFLLLHSNKNIMTYQKINHNSFLCDKKINFVFCASQFYYTQFLRYTLSAFWSSSYWSWKQRNFYSIFYSPVWYTEAVTK